MKRILGHAKRVAVIVGGSVVLLAGIAMLVLPGPAILVIPLGLTILSTEVPAARKIIERARAWAADRQRELFRRRTLKRLKALLHDRRRDVRTHYRRIPDRPVTVPRGSRTHG